MFKTERILLILLVGICFLVSIVIIDSIVDPAELIWTVIGQVNPQEGTPPVIPDSPPQIPEEEDVYKPPSTNVPEGWDLFRNEAYAFEIGYPSAAVQKSIPDQGALNLSLGHPEDSPLWEFQLRDPAYFQGTNLVSASMVIQVTRGGEAIASCTTYKDGSQYQRSKEPLPQVVLNQNRFVQDRVQEGVMGGSYHNVSYRLIHQDACYEITQIIQTRNIDNYPADTVVRYDQEQVQGIFDQVLNTFTLLDVQATFPEVSYPEIKTPDQTDLIDTAAGGYADGIDVSHWQGDIGWLKVADAGISFAFVKATEGVSYTDYMLANNMAEGANAGVYLGVYHFARPDLDNTGKEEAEYFLSVAGDYLESGYLRPVLDLEVGGSLGKAALSSWVLDWLRTVENQTGIAPLVYTNLFFINNYITDAVTEYDLWMAYWNCDPTVTATIPPTGKWPDWAFWQYCVAAPNTIPGIKTTIDLDIYNGIESSLDQYDAASRLWVSIISDAKQAPVPYYADLTIDVNGDATGLIDYDIWWDCGSLETDISLVEAACGALPEPVPGECVIDDQVGMRCVEMEADQLLAEHTYREVAYYSPKVIVERGEGSPVEDRYQFYAHNPIVLIAPVPESPGTGEYYQDYSLDVSVTTKTTLQGALQVDVFDNDSGDLLDAGCVAVSHDETETNLFSYLLPWSVNGPRVYSIWARYRAEGACPVADDHPDDVLLEYQIDWPLLPVDDIGIYNPELASWALKSEKNSSWDDVTWFKFGPAGEDWIPVEGDWDGDGVDTIGLYNPGNGAFNLKEANGPGWDDVNWFIFKPNDLTGIPVAGDWDGDGIDTIGLYDPVLSEWFLSAENSSQGEVTNYIFGPGGEGRLPIAGDWDGDGIDTIGLYYPANSSFSLKSEHAAGWDDVVWFVFGPPDSGRKPIAGDWDGSGLDRIGLYDPAAGRWFLKSENASGWEDVLIFRFGSGGNKIPLTGIWH